MADDHPSDDAGLDCFLWRPEDESQDETAIMAGLFVDVLRTRYNVLSLKNYRIEVVDAGVPVTPCLDHETQIHEHDLPHLGAYLQDRESGALASVTYVPQRAQITIEEETPGAASVLEALATFLRERYTEVDVRVLRVRSGSAYQRARAVAEAHLPLSRVLTGEDHDAIQMKLTQLNGISTLMEKSSRVSSWGIRTTYAPVAAAFAFVAVLAFPIEGQRLTEWTAVDWTRALLLLVFGAVFLYYGLKAVQLTKAAMRLNKRIREYEFILGQRLAPTSPPVAKIVRATEPPPELLERARGALTEGARQVSPLARIVRAQGEISAALDGRPPGGRGPLAQALVALRQASVEDQIAAREEALEGLDCQDHDARAIALRTRHRCALEILRRKAKALEQLAAP